MSFNLNPPRWVRAILYLAAALGTIVLQWATDENWLDKPTRTMLASLIAFIMLLAVGNSVAQVATQRRARRRE